MRIGYLQIGLLACQVALGAGGVCPAGLPVGTPSNGCYFGAATGADTNTGTDEAHPWLHFPGMANCANNCATLQTALGGPGYASQYGYGFILRGGDTWHEGNSSPSDGFPYTGGTWWLRWSGKPSTCVYEGTMTGCFYVGVDTAWFNSSVCGASFCRPVINGDNPASTSLVSSCAYYPIANYPSQASSSFGNVLLAVTDASSYHYLDSLELTGLCSNDANDPTFWSGHMGNAAYDTFLLNNGAFGAPQLDIYNNLYLHNLTKTTAAFNAQGVAPCSPDCLMGGALSGGAFLAIIGMVQDFSDSQPGNIASGFLSIYHMKDSIFRYIGNITAATCHDIHDNIFEYYHAPAVPNGTHGNMLECNGDWPTGNANYPNAQANVFYNNTMRHFDPTWSTAGEVTLWFCPNTVPEYWFNNIQYDLVASHGGTWAVVGPPTYSGCTNTGKQYFFNNTILDSKFDCAGSNNNTGGQYLYAYNNHLISSAGGTSNYSGTTCNGGTGSATNVAMSYTTANAQGYTSGSNGTALTGNNCANDATPCAPSAAGNATVSAGTNEQAYCTALAALTNEPAIGTEAASACKYGTTDGCAYNATTHTMSCPAQAAVLRPASGAWDSGAYQYQAGAPAQPGLLSSGVRIAGVATRAEGKRALR